MNQENSSSSASRILSETPLSFRGVVSLKEKLDGKRPALGAIYRWANSGVRGIRLEYVQGPSGRFTSVAAVHRFFLASTPSSAVHAGGELTAEQPKCHKRAKERVDRKLRSAHLRPPKSKVDGRGRP